MSAPTSAGTVTHTVLPTRLGEVTVVKEDDSLTGLYFPRHWPRPDRSAFGARAAAGFEEVARQLAEYLAGRRDVFDLPLKVSGTQFDRLVWDLIREVPYGRTTSYGDLARRLGNGASPQDVGAAVGRNPLCVIIPCHRIVGSTGKLTGYAGGLERKRALLDIEQWRPRLGDPKFRAAFPDLIFWGTADLIAEGDYVVGRWEGGGTHSGAAFDDMPVGALPANTGRTMRFTGTTVLKVENGLITEEIGLDDGLTCLRQLGLITEA